jgi:hydrogenase maturation protease
MASDRCTVLLIGYGNPGRRDDGLGPALAERIAELNIDGVTVDSDYQLTVEDAAAVAEHDVVVLADADVSGPEPYWFRRVSPQASISFSSHSVNPEAVLGLARHLFQVQTKGYILGIRGYEFNEFDESLSDRARDNLDAAVKFIESVLKSGNFEDAVSDIDESSVTSATDSSEDTTCKTENT